MTRTLTLGTHWAQCQMRTLSHAAKLPGKTFSPRIRIWGSCLTEFRSWRLESTERCIWLLSASENHLLAIPVSASCTSANTVPAVAPGSAGLLIDPCILPWLPQSTPLPTNCCHFRKLSTPLWKPSSFPSETSGHQTALSDPKSLRSPFSKGPTMIKDESHLLGWQSYWCGL